MIYSKILILISMLICFSCHFDGRNFASQKQNWENVDRVLPKDSLELKAEIGLVFYQGKPFSGTSEEYYPNKVLASSIQYIKGKKQGVYEKYFPNGLKSFEAKYFEGRREGIAKTWWSNGNQRSESQYKSGKVHGIQRQWYKSGTKFKRRNIVDGKEQGLQQSWRENGKLYNNYEAKDGRIFGLKRASLCYELDNEVIQYQTD